MTQQGIQEGVDIRDNAQEENQPEVSLNTGSENQGQLTEEDQKVSWLELFFDLIFVTSFDQLAKRLGDSFAPENIIVFLLMFVALWSVWSGNTQFAARFGNDSKIYRWGTLLELLTLGVLSLTLRSDVEHTGWLFAAAYAFNRFTLVGMYLLLAHKEPGARQYARVTAAGLALSGVLWLLSMPTSHTLTLVLWGLALLVTVLTPVPAQRYHHHALPHHEHLPERVGLLQIIALGGIVTEVVVGGRQQEMTLLGQLPTFLALVTCIAMFRLYFDQSRALPVLVANLQSRGGTLMSWLYAHLPLTIAIMMVGVGFGHGIAYEDEHHDQLNLTLVSWAMAAVFGSLALIRYNSSRLTRVPSLDRSMLTLLAGAVASALLALSHLGTLSLHLATAAVTVVAALIIATDPASQRLGKVEEAVLDEHGSEE
ncbi:low temperature requirement protein A [Deinococcus radiophilus]|uniref:Low temperature requirement protein A n=3 Tax=Deinococcus radiophilus TaxID=32062 RepID=A0A3S0IPI3_9DEIO|nr:low temperature requirement protein A [Deinococcus radiophilus]RTR28641.1 low temperature requirement protein A [Deinococcus radiophilus]